MYSSTIVDKLYQSAQAFPDKVAFRFINNDESENSLLFSDLESQSKTIARYLTTLSSPQERTILLFNPGIDYILALFGTICAQQIPVSMYLPRPKKADSLLHVFQDAKPRLCLTTQALKKQYEQVLEQASNLFNIRVLTLEEIWAETPMFVSKLIHPSLEDIAFLQYTSGSTGNPKGVVITHSNLMDNLTQIQKKFQSSHKDIGVFWLPPYHDMGLVGAIFEPVFLGMSVTLMSPMSFIQRPFRWLHEISKTKATVSGGPNFAFDLCSQRITEEQLSTLDLSSLPLMFSGAERIRYKTFDRFIKRFSSVGLNPNALYFCYGMAESTLIISGDFISLPDIQPEEELPILSCGSPLETLQVKIVDPSTLTILPDKQIGEIWVQGPSIASGYWQNKNATESTFLAMLPEISGHFLRTGDKGYLNNNQLYVSGRIKELIILNGKNYFPHDIEQSISEISTMFHGGGIAAFSIEGTQDEKLIIVCEVSRVGLPYFKEAEVKMDIQEALSQTLSITPDDIVFVLERSITRTSSGKLKRLECRELYEKKQLKLISSLAYSEALLECP